jgi:hypothetical protein
MGYVVKWRVNPPKIYFPGGSYPHFISIKSQARPPGGFETDIIISLFFSSIATLGKTRA